ncbi:MAG: DEAD/DEAH box helicase family protein [Prevotella sp.]|jgi:hypothetical protein|nr:DEAD/DEAH box helicase family protein [Prevotella sp.]
MEEETTHNDCYEIKDENIFNQPIDYMRLDIDDFKGFNVSKDLIDIPEGKYLTETIIAKNIYPLITDTTVINSSVGDGKSFLALEMTRRFLTSDKFKGYGVIFVAPHKSLVKEYKRLFKRVLPDVPIPNYEYLKETPYDRTPNARNSKDAKHPNNINYNSQLPLHVITIDCLTGNTEDGTEQKAIKRKYIENIISYGKEHNGKIIFVMDEVHDAIDNFKPELIPSLWRFKTSGILHKIFVLSATFNEASKVVIKYLADITDKNLHIVESTRKQLPDNKLSDLHIHITSNSNYDFNNEEFVELFRDIINKHDHIDILSYSASIVSEKLTINDSPIRQILDNQKNQVNICLSQEKLNFLKKDDFAPASLKSEYLTSSNNIGTIFKTGISIKDKPNNAYIIILPSKVSSSKGKVNRGKGIFSSGSIDLIQALARVRDKADIYLIMPKPQELIIPQIISYNSANYNYITGIPTLEILRKARKQTEEKLDKDGKVYLNGYDELGFNSQKELLVTIYNKYYSRVSDEIKLAERHSGIKYPELDEFILSKGEKFISNYYAIFGKDLSAYAIWAAFNNQFVNCRLKTISSPKQSEPAITIKHDDTIQDLLLNIFMEYVSDNESLIQANDCQIYTEFKDNVLIKEYGEKLKDIISNNKLQHHIMTFIQRSLKSNNRLWRKYYKEVNGHIQDIPFEAEDYLLCCIANADLYTGEETIEEQETGRQLIEAYKKLGEIRQLFSSYRFVMVNPKGNRPYIYRDYIKYGNLFDTELINEIISTIRIIDEKDNYFSKFEKLQKINYDNITEAFTPVYNLLRSTFFEVISKDQREPIKITREKGHETRLYIDYVETIELPVRRTGINLLYKYDYNHYENNDNLRLEELLQNGIDLVGEDYDAYMQKDPNWGLDENIPVPILIKDGDSYKAEIRKIE